MYYSFYESEVVFGFVLPWFCKSPFSFHDEAWRPDMTANRESREPHFRDQDYLVRTPVFIHSRLLARHLDDINRVILKACDKSFQIGVFVPVIVIAEHAPSAFSYQNPVISGTRSWSLFHVSGIFFYGYELGSGVPAVFGHEVYHVLWWCPVIYDNVLEGLESLVSKVIQ